MIIIFMAFCAGMVFAAVILIRNEYTLWDELAPTMLFFGAVAAILAGGAELVL